MTVLWKVRARCIRAFHGLHFPVLDCSILSLGLDSRVLFDSMFPWDMGGLRKYKGLRIFCFEQIGGMSHSSVDMHILIF